MSRGAHVPRALRIAPFTLDEARSAGVTAQELKGPAWHRIGWKLYRAADLNDDPWKLLAAWRRLLPEEAVFAGLTAAWLHGLDVKPTDPIEIAIPHRLVIRRAGLRVRRCLVSPDEAVTIKGNRATSLHRTLRDLCLKPDPLESLIAIDMAIRLRRTSKPALGAYVGGMTGRPGVRRLRRLVEVAEPAESPMETRLRWLLLKAGVPRPQVQIDLHDADGGFVGRADLYYPQARLVIEFDGGNHRDRLVSDDRRQNLLTNAGFQVLRFTSPDIYQRPEMVVAQVRGTLPRKVSAMAERERFELSMGQ